MRTGRPVTSDSYSAIHQHLRRKYPKSGRCVQCGTQGRTEYALIDGQEHARDISRYLELCPRCHRRYDLSALTEQDRRELTAAALAGASALSLAHERGVGARAVLKVLREVPGAVRPGVRLNAETAAEIRQRRLAGEKPAALAAEFGISPRHVWQIATGLSWSA